MTTVTADIDTAVEFLKQYRPTGPWVLTSVSIVHGTKTETGTFRPDTENKLRSWLEGEVKAQRNIYYHSNPTLYAMAKKASRTDIASVDWFHVDIDPDPGEDLRAEQERILALLQKSPGLPKPTLIIYSGGGYQASWRLANPIDINGDLSKAIEVARYNIQIQNQLGGDGCHNVDRLMRLPGTVNFPNEKKLKKGRQIVRSEVVLFTDDVYDISQFTKAPERQGTLNFDGAKGGVQVVISGNVPRLVDTDQLGDKVSDRVKAVIVQGKDTEQPLRGPTNDQSRSAWLFYVVCQLVEAEIEHDVIYSVITDPDFKISESVLEKGSAAAVERYALRQITQAVEHKINPVLQRINAEYAYVESLGMRCRVVKQYWDPSMQRNTTDYLLPDQFAMTWGNVTATIKVQNAKGDWEEKEVPAGKWWLRHKHRRNYAKVVFAPNENHPGCLNLWQGFACDSRQGDCSLYLDHLKQILCKGDEENYQYLIKWMAFAVQYPGKVPESALVMRGKPGSGKTTMAKHFGKLFGCHFWHVTDKEHVVGRFNGSLEDACLVFADEAFAGSKEHASNLKILISETTVNLENKGIMVSVFRNCCHLIMASNEDWVVPVTCDDRRFFILDISDDRACDTDYFGAMEDQMNAGGYEALLYYLLNMDITKFQVRNPPKTDEHRRQQMHTLSADYHWWFQKLQDGRLLTTDGKWEEWAYNYYMNAEFAALFPGMRPTGVSRKLNKFLDDVCPKSWPQNGQKAEPLYARDESGQERAYNRPSVRYFPSLQACRDAWEAKFGPVDWDEIQ